jgi:replicative DNA helicase
MVIDPDSIGIAIEMLSDVDFYKPEHAMIYNALVRLYGNDVPVDQLTLIEQLKRDGNIEHIGGELTISGLYRETASSANIVQHARILKDKTLKRKLISVANTVMGRAYEDKSEAEELLMELESMTSQAWSNRQESYTSVSAKVHDVVNRLEDINERPNRLIGINTGISMLNGVTGGWQSGRLTVLAGKTGGGKTALALEFASQSARNGIPVAIFSLEAPAEEVTTRLVQSNAPFDMMKIYNQKLTADDWSVINDGAAKVHDYHIYVNDQSGLSITELIAKAKRLKRERNIGLVIVDYLQLVEGIGYNREQEVASVSRGLKNMAMNMQLPVIAISQFSRAADQREEPRLSHLRESGAIEQDADTVIMLYNRHETKGEGEFHDYGEDVYNEFVRELIVKKNRGGKSGDRILLYWKPEFTRIGELGYDMQKYLDR